jgi:hypothetical protein
VIRSWGNTQWVGTSMFQPSTILHLRLPGGSRVAACACGQGSYPLKQEKISEKRNYQAHPCPIWCFINHSNMINGPQRGLHPTWYSLYSDGTLNCPLHHTCNTLLERKHKHKYVTRWIVGLRLLTARLPLAEPSSRMDPPWWPFASSEQSKWEPHVACFPRSVGPTLFSLFSNPLM